MIEVGIILSRVLHYTASLILFGVILFPLYAYPGRAGSTERTNRWLLEAAGWAALAALLSGLLWFGCVVVSVTDGAPSWDDIQSVLNETFFGEVWIARFVLVTITLFFIALRAFSLRGRPNWALAALCAGLVASLAGVGHTQLHEGTDGIIHTIADGLHLLAAGAWLGGLVPLSYLVATALRAISPNRDVEASNAALRFSGMGYVAVAILIGSGLINSWLLVGSFANLISTPYGQLLLAKMLLFVGMLGLAACNRFLIVPRLIEANEVGEQAFILTRLRRHILVEQALGLFIISIVSALGAMEPAITSGRP